MDNITHSLFGALIGQAGFKRRTGLAMPALIIGANIPDVDAACLFWLDGVEHLGFRRGITHGPIAWVVLPLMLAGALWGYDRWQEMRGTRPEGRLPVSFRWLFLLSFIACLTHPALDWLNVYGIRLLEPFSHRWFYGDTLFIVDVWLWALMGFATWFSLRRERNGGEWMKPAWIAMAVSLAYIVMNVAISAEAKRSAVGRFIDIPAIASPVPLAFWEREIIWHWPDAEPEIARPVWGDWSMANGIDDDVASTQKVVFIEEYGAKLLSAREVGETDSQVAAFLFWSRTPFVECALDGSVILRDARFYNPLVRDRFSVALPDVKCDPFAQSSP